MIYSVTTRLAEVLLRLHTRISGSETLRQRLMLAALPAPADIWIHGASVGELTSARPIIEALAERLRVQVTANSQTGRDLAAGWGLPVQLAPLDMPGALTRFLDALQPRLAVTIEGEFWPLRSRILDQRGIPQAMIGARMSQRSANKWARIRNLITPVLGRITALSAQDAGSEARLLALGLPKRAILPQLDLKLLNPAAISPPPDDPDRSRVVLAASTHEGEDAAILDAWQEARRTYPDLQLILAPRHPQRGDQIAALIAARGLKVQRRSAGAENGALLLADTLGEMPCWYTRAGICFVGGSLTENGGHTPWEPAAYRCAILTGPHVSNHADNFAALIAASGAQQITAQTLGLVLTQLAGDPAVARAMGQSARNLLEQRAGDPSRLIARLCDLAKTVPNHNISGR